MLEASVVPTLDSRSGPVRRLLTARVPERRFRQLSLLTLISLVVLIGSGGWVRLSESGLGCPTWPNCYANRVVAHDTYHALIEFVNRCVITTVGVLIVLMLIAALRRRNPRRDLVWLSAGLIAGYVGEAVLGGITVLLKLAPELVAAHLILAMLVLADAVILHWRAGDARWAAAPGEVEARVPRAGVEVRRLGQLLLAVTATVIVLGTVATGSGPHAGSPGTPRFGFNFTQTVELHAIVGMFLFGLVIAIFFTLRATDAPRRLRSMHLGLVGLMALQGTIGYVQYFTKLQIDLVEVHIVTAALLVVAVVRFNLELGRPRTPEAETVSAVSPARTLLSPQGSPQSVSQ